MGPVMTTGLVLVYLASFPIRWASIPLQGFRRFAGIAVPLGLMGVSVCVLVERIQEIRSGEEDDLGKY